MSKKSDFGKGLTYCLGLFLCHSEQDKYLPPKEKKLGICNVRTWFYGASDHLMELDSSIVKNERLKNRIDCFVKKCWTWRFPSRKHENPTEKDKEWAIDEAKKLLFLLDKYFGVKAKKATWK